MLSFLYKFIRFVVIVGAVLLLGQIPVEGRTIGEHFSLWVKNGFKKTQEKISKSTLVASLPRYLPGANQKIGPQSNDDSKKISDEAISSSDRESLLRVLQ